MIIENVLAELLGMKVIQGASDRGDKVTNHPVDSGQRRKVLFITAVVLGEAALLIAAWSVGLLA